MDIRTISVQTIFSNIRKNLAIKKPNRKFDYIQPTRVGYAFD